MTLPTEIAEVLEGKRRWCVVQGDCRDILPLLPDDSITHTYTDPPYEAEAHTSQRRLMTGTRRSGGGGWKPGDKTVSAPLDFPAITPAERDFIGGHIARVTKRWALVFCQVEATEKWRLALTAEGFHGYVRTCVYVKQDPQPQMTGDRPGMGYECFVVTHPAGRKRWNAGGRCGVFYSLSGKDVDRRDGQSIHDAQKPTALAVEIADCFFEPGDVVLDAYAGSATFAVAALRRGCRAICIEKDPRHVATARARLEAESQGISYIAAKAGQIALFGGAK